MRDKRGETESYSFLIGLIITFLMLSAVGCVVYEMYSRSSESGDSFKNLAETIKKLKDGEEGKMPLFVGEGYIIVGFRSDGKTIKSESGGKGTGYCYNWFTERGSLTIDRPEKCKGKSCICLCEHTKDQPKTVNLESKDNNIFTNSEVCSGTEDTCITDGIDQYNFVGGGGCSIAFIPSVKGNPFKRIEYERGIALEKRGITVVHYKREGNTIILSDEEIRKEDTEKIKLPK